MLSNTATPKYYGEFRQAVIDGQIPVCQNISMEMNRIDELIRNPKYYYDPKPVEGYIRFCEAELTLTDGSPLKLLPTFKLWAEQIYGWYFFEKRSVYRPNQNGPGGHYENRTIKKRLTQKQFLIVARGAAKSLYDETHHGYGLVVDTKTTNQVAIAPTMAQADEILGPLRTAITISRGPVFKFLTLGSLQNTTGDRMLRQKLVSTKKGIQNFLTNSLLEIRPMTIQKNQGYRDTIATIDEWLSCDIREDIIGAVEQGSSKNEDYLIIASSSEGTIRNGAGDSIKMELMDILKGEYYAPNVSIWWYCLDNVKEVGYPELWKKANPNLGDTVSYTVYQQEVERAEKVPSVRNDILAKRFGIATEGFTYFFTYEETKCHRKRHFWKMPCALGADLSQGDDFCAFTFNFPLHDEFFGIKVRAYITERTLMALQPSMRERYEDFIQEGTLMVMPGTILKMDDVYEDLDEFIMTNQYEVLCFGYDPYNSTEFVERWEREHGSFGIVKVPQGYKTETVPLGNMKKLAEQKKLWFDEELMKFSMGNCIVMEDTKGNRKLMKKRREEKIDNVSALMDSFVAYTAFSQLF